jgi:hypothetical protein
MKPKFDLKNNAESLLKTTVDFQADLIRYRTKSNEEYREEESNEHNIFRITLDGLLVRCVKQLGQPIENTNEKISYQISLIISFARTHFIINDMILEGDLIEAFTLMRKNLESLTRLNEIDQKPLRKLLRKTPNVINVLGKAGKALYPTLSEIAHFGTPEVGNLLSVKSHDDGRTGPSLYPTYNEHSKSCYDRHAFISINFTFYLMQFLTKVYDEKYDSEFDHSTFFIMVKMAEDIGMIEKLN